MPDRHIVLQCPLCGTDEALVCKVVATGEGWWVTRARQTCACDVYDAWDEVWWQARHSIQRAERMGHHGKP